MEEGNGQSYLYCACCCSDKTHPSSPCTSSNTGGLGAAFGILTGRLVDDCQLFFGGDNVAAAAGQPCSRSPPLHAAIGVNVPKPGSFGWMVATTVNGLLTKLDKLRASA